MYYTSGNEAESNWDISGIIELSGEVRGIVAISMNESVAYKLTEGLSGNKHSSIDDVVVDAIGEIINIIMGNVKKEFENDFKVNISTPLIVKGKSQAIAWPASKSRIICIPFTIFSDEEICLSIAVDTSN